MPWFAGYDGNKRIPRDEVGGYQVIKNNTLVLVSRAVALYLICWAASELTYLPSRIFSLTYHLGQQSVLATSSYWRDTDLLSLGMPIFRIVALFTTAFWLYQCGPTVRAYFLSAGKVEAGSAGPASA
jgi:hypothetical protein